MRSNSSNPNATSRPAASSASRAEPRAAGRPWPRSAGLVLAPLLALSGCSDAKINELVGRVLQPKKSPQQNLLVAFASEDPDVRRDALARVARSKQFDADWAIQGYMAIALLDIDPQARCVAMRVLGRTGDPRAAETALKLLNHRAHPPEEVRPPDGLCRWDAAEALARMSAAEQVPAEQREAVRGTLTERLKIDPDRQVRIAAAAGLGCYPHEESLRALISRLEDEDFAVVHQCEESLVKLTGRTHGCDVFAWQDWLTANSGQWFAHAGEIPESRRPPYRTRWEKTNHDVREFMSWLVPGRKEN